MQKLPAILMTALVVFMSFGTSIVPAKAASCSFTVNAVSGPVTMSAYINKSLNASSPSGASIPGLQEVLRVDIQALDSGCSNVTLRGIGVEVTATDMDSTGWVTSMASSGMQIVDLSTGSVVGTVTGTVTASGKVRFRLNGASNLISSGETHPLAFYVDTTGASTASDDVLRADVMESSIQWGDSTKAIREANARITGGTLSF